MFVQPHVDNVWNKIFVTRWNSLHSVFTFSIHVNIDKNNCIVCDMKCSKAYNLDCCALTFTATRYLPPYTPHVGPFDPVTFKEAALFT